MKGNCPLLPAEVPPRKFWRDLKNNIKTANYRVDSFQWAVVACIATWAETEHMVPYPRGFFLPFVVVSMLLVLVGRRND